MKVMFWPLAAFAMVSGQLAQAAPPPTGGDPTAVSGLVVTAERPQTQALIDRKIYSVSADLQSTVGSAADVLNNVPSVAVDADGNVSLQGDSHVTILVDGKPAAQFSGAAQGQSLLQFPAADIDRIEVLTNPPAQYKAEGSGGVINIVTRKTRKAGASGLARLSAGDKRRYVLGVDGSYNTGPLKLSGGIGLRQDAKERLTRSDRTETDPASAAVTRSQQRIDEHFHRLIPSVKAAVDYELNPRQSFGADYSHRELKGVRFFDQGDLSGPSGQAPSGLSDRHSDGREWSVDGAEGLHFEQNLSRPDETLSLALRRSVSRERERYAYRNSFTLPPGPPTFDDLHLSFDLGKTEFAADYELPLSDQRDLKLGYAFEDDSNAFDNLGDTLDPGSRQPTVNPVVTNHFRYHQRVHAAYGDYQTPLGAWRLDAGLRVEATEVSTQQITGGIAGGRNEVAAYPSLHLDRALGDSAKLTAGISRRVTRPDPESLNPFADHQDIHNLRAGNPNLLPKDTWAYELGYRADGRALTYAATAYYRFDRNSVTDILRPVGGDVILATKTNLPKSRSAGLELSANGKLGGQLAYNLSGDLFTSQIDASALGSAGLKSTAGLNVKASLDWRPTAADAAQVSFSRVDRRLTPQGEVRAINLVNIGLRRQLRPDLSIVATVSDLFDGQRQQRLVKTPLLRDDYLRHQYGRIAYLGLIYSFGGPARSKGPGFDYEQ